MAEVKGTGEEGWAPDAAELDGLDDFLLPEEADEPTGEEAEQDVQEPEGTSLDDFFSEDDEGTGEFSGEADLPDQTDEEQSEQGEPLEQNEKKDSELPDDYYKSQAEVDRAFRKREAAIAKKVRQQVEAEFAEQFGVEPDKLGDKAIETKARELMQKFPEKFDDFEYAKEIAKAQVAKTPRAQQQDTYDADEGRSESNEQFKERIKAEEENIRLVTGNDNFSVAAMYRNNEAFRAELELSGSASRAYNAAIRAKRAADAQASQLKKQGEKEAVKKIQASSKKATTTTKGKPQGRRTAANMSDAEIDRLNEAALAGRGDIIIPG